MDRRGQDGSEYLMLEIIILLFLTPLAFGSLLVIYSCGMNVIGHIWFKGAKPRFIPDCVDIHNTPLWEMGKPNEMYPRDPHKVHTVTIEFEYDLSGADAVGKVIYSQDTASHREMWEFFHQFGASRVDEVLRATREIDARD